MNNATKSYKMERLSKVVKRLCTIGYLKIAGPARVKLLCYRVQAVAVRVYHLLSATLHQRDSTSRTLPGCCNLYHGVRVH